MASVRINICLPEELLLDLRTEVKSRRLSAFITDCIKRAIAEKRRTKLADEYKEAFAETKTNYEDMEGTLHDGLS
jgi:post-segregation antitoxin (ccd killing protein)